MSAALVSTLVGLAASNFGIIPFEVPAYSIVLEFLLPLSIPLLLYRADLCSDAVHGDFALSFRAWISCDYGWNSRGIFNGAHHWVQIIGK